MRIATWNVAYGRGAEVNRRRRALLASTDADVWILTETHDDLDPGPDYRCVCSIQRPAGAREVVSGSRWVAIWSRRPFLESDLATRDQERTAAAVVEGPDGRRLLVFGTVLPWYGDTGRTVVEEVAKQQEDWSSLAIDYDALICVAGDFNVNLGGPHYYGSKASKGAVRRALERSGLVALTDFDATKPVEDQSGCGLIDHIAVSNQLQQIRSSPETWPRRDADGVPVSDHVGVVVELAS